jgi:cell division protein FtsQ
VSTTLPMAPAGLGGGAAPGGSPAGARHRVLIAAVLVVALLAVLTVWIVAFSSVLGVKTITVRGNRHLTAAQVRTAAAISTGTPLVRVDTTAVAHRVEALAAVADATVRTDYPTTVIITLTERTAVGYVAAAHGYLLVDRTGDQYRSERAKPHGLPLFVVPTGTQAKATGRAVATVAAALSAKLLAHVASVQAFDPTAITLRLDDGRLVRWGGAARSADKARILPVLLHQPGATFDVTDPDQVVAR